MRRTLTLTNKNGGLVTLDPMEIKSLGEVHKPTGVRVTNIWVRRAGQSPKPHYTVRESVEEILRAAPGIRPRVLRPLTPMDVRLYKARGNSRGAKKMRKNNQKRARKALARKEAGLPTKLWPVIEPPKKRQFVPRVIVRKKEK